MNVVERVAAAVHGWLLRDHERRAAAERDCRHDGSEPMCLDCWLADNPPP